MLTQPEDGLERSPAAVSNDSYVDTHQLWDVPLAHRMAGRQVCGHAVCCPLKPVDGGWSSRWWLVGSCLCCVIGFSFGGPQLHCLLWGAAVCTKAATNI